MPGNEYLSSPSPSQDKSKFGSANKAVLNSTAYSFTPEELASAIRPQSILANAELAQKFLKPPKSESKSGFGQNAAKLEAG